MKRLPSLPALQTFVITAQCCSFTRAAEKLHLTQGAVSRQIASLEAQLGYSLFLRQARGLALTPKGRQLLPSIQQAFDLVQTAIDTVAGDGRALQLKAPTCAMRWLWPRLMRWQNDRPDVPVELTTTVQQGVDFNHEPFDAALIYGRPPGPGTNARHLFDEQLTPVCSPQLLKGPAGLREVSDLQQHMLLHPSRDEQDWTVWLQAAGSTLSNLNKGQHFETLDLAMSVASQGTGVAIGDWALIAEDLVHGRLAMPFDLKVPTGAGYYLVHPARTTPAYGLLELLEWLEGEAAVR